MTDQTIPASVKLAAKRGFIRTTAQAYAGTLTTGVAATTIIGLYTGQIEVVPTLITGVVAVVSPFLAGAASYLSIIAKGLPEDYIPAAVNQSFDV